MKNGAEKRKRSILCRIGAAALCVLLGGFILLRSLPVSWDAGACAAGTRRLCSTNTAASW